ncbi:NMD protein [Candidatus Scalindua japonica]|uniref:NMD protein n=2 Tax=Candidatus Scalindua japonica TaxID=1284222 RepID=A0A286U092_9BACT|nr:NMD protein [Candidatus Scalindua japonica]
MPFTVGYWEIALAIGLYAAATKQLTGLFDERFIFVFAFYFSIAGAVFYCFISAFTLWHLIVIPVWRVILAQTLTIKWHWLRKGAVGILQFAVYTINIRWFIAGMATITTFSASTSYDNKIVSTCLESATGRHLLEEVIKTGTTHSQKKE